MTKRGNLGFSDALNDLSTFTPLHRPKAKPIPADAAEAAGFTSREPQAAPPVRQQRRHRTGRSSQINIKATPDTIAAFYAWADEQGLSLAEAFEVAIRKLTDS